MKYPVTPADILAQRAAARARGALAHTYNADGHIKRDVGCSCYECRDFYDPQGVEDARRANSVPQGGAGARGFLARADAEPLGNPVGARGMWPTLARADAEPLGNPLVSGRGFLARADAEPPQTPNLRAPFLPRADGVIPTESPLLLGQIPPPPSPPRLERQRAVCYDENGVDILAAGQRVAAALRGLPTAAARDRGSRFELGPEHAAIQPLRNLLAHYEAQMQDLQHQTTIQHRHLEDLQVKLAQTRALLERLDSIV